MIRASISKSSEKRFFTQLEKLAKVTGKDMEDVLKQQGRLIAVEAIGWTERIRGGGRTSAAQGRNHKEDVRKTVFSTYRDAANAGKYLSAYGPKTSQRWQNYLKRKEVGKMQQMADTMKLSKFYGGKKVKIMAWDGGKAHRRRLKGTGAKGVVRLVVDYKKVEPYAKEKMKNVGRAKSGWARAAAQLGDSLARVPAYIKTSHHKVRGYGRVRGRGVKSVLTVRNNAEYGLVDGLIKSIINKRIPKMRKNIKHILDAQTKKHIEKI